MIQPIVFDATTPRHAMPLLIPGQAQKELFVNESLALIDMLLHPVVTGSAAAPPTSPAEGECWIVEAQAVDAWDGQEDAIAGWDGAHWTFATPADGLAVHDLSTGAKRHFSGGWTSAPVVESPTGGSVIDSEARAAVDSLLAAVRQAGLIA